MIVYLDEVARGSLYGIVVASAVILPDELITPPFDLKSYDSKKISPKKRNIISDWIKQNCLEYSIGIVNADEIDKHNIYNSTMLAFHKSLDMLKLPFTKIYVDGNRFKTYINDDDFVPHKCFIKGDSNCLGIGLASILAKVYHTEYIKEECLRYPELNDKYDLLNNQGYGTKKHIDGILKHGFSENHRLTYKIKRIPEEFYTDYLEKKEKKEKNINI